MFKHVYNYEINTPHPIENSAIKFLESYAILASANTKLLEPHIIH